MTDQAPLRILACQIDIPPMTSADERDQHLERVAAIVREMLTEHPADLVVLPELASIDYSRAVFDRLDDLAEPLDGVSFRAWSGVARDLGVHVAYGFARRSEDKYFISVAVVNPQGELLGHYDKLHLAQYGASMEKDYFTCGNHVFLFEIKGFRLAPIICYDIRIPELSRTLVVDRGAVVILHCGAYYRDCSFRSWHDFALTRAIENQCYLLSLNRAGAHYGNSIFCRPWHDETIPPLIFPQQEEAFRLVELTHQELDQVRTSFSFLRDRLDSYDLPS